MTSDLGLYPAANADSGCIVEQVKDSEDTMHLPGMMFRGIAVLAIVATAAAPMRVWADGGGDHGRDGGDAELRHQEDEDAAVVAPTATPAGAPATVPTSTPTPAAAPAAVTAPAASAAAMALSIVEGAGPQDWGFTPAQLSTTVGTTLTWTNAGAHDHTVTSDDGSTFDSHGLGPNAAFSFTPTTAGTFGYHCAIHPFMKATLTVT